jgi:NAD(P)-dependent dehydrogenase (short-subunit alcohol dehydrogenase family)
MTERLKSLVAVVTGGFGALGRAVAERLVAEGACVALLDRAPLPVGGVTEGVALAWMGSISRTGRLALPPTALSRLAWVASMQSSMSQVDLSGSR